MTNSTIWTSCSGKTRTQPIPTQGISFSLPRLPSAVPSPCGSWQCLVYDYEIKVMSSVKSSQRLRPPGLMCHKLCDRTHSAITSQGLEPPWDVELYCRAGSLGFESYFVIICRWSPECMFPVFLPFDPECHLAWVVRMVALWEGGLCSFHWNLSSSNKQSV